MSKAAELQSQIRYHPIVLGNQLDGKPDFWYCLESGSLIQRRLRNPEVDEEDEEEEENASTSMWRRYCHPLAALRERCDGMTCQHVLLGQIVKVKDLQRLLETLDQMQKDAAARHELDSNS